MEGGRPCHGEMWVDHSRSFASESIGHPAKDALHHSEMLLICLGLKDRVPTDEFEEEAAQRKHVARVGPA